MQQSGPSASVRGEHEMLHESTTGTAHTPVSLDSHVRLDCVREGGRGVLVSRYIVYVLVRVCVVCATHASLARGRSAQNACGFWTQKLVNLEVDAKSVVREAAIYSSARILRRVLGVPAPR